MADVVAKPVFIFLPIGRDPDENDVVVDPVCGRALHRDQIAGRLLHAGRHHYFCSLGCAEQFASSVRELEA